VRVAVFQFDGDDKCVFVSDPSSAGAFEGSLVHIARAGQHVVGNLEAVEPGEHGLNALVVLRFYSHGDVVPRKRANVADREFHFLSQQIAAVATAQWRFGPE